MKTHSEWIAIFRGYGFDDGIIWHLMHDMYALGLVTIPTGM